MQDIKELVLELMEAAAARGFAEFELETAGFKLKLKMNGGAAVPSAAVSAPGAAASAPDAAEGASGAAVSAHGAAGAAGAAASAPGAAAPASAAPDQLEGTPVEAPLVGIFYAAPAPEAPPFIEVGQNVKKGDTLFIIEAMKTMNEIPAPCDGRISHILAQHGEMVEYGQVVVVMEESK